ncbi:Aerobic cobaltochelatase CobN subunit, partial [hydrothermal vent metagenome]
MHLLAAQAGILQQEGEAIDLGQSPGKIIFASAADSELSAMAGAIDRAGSNDLRLANVLALAHNMSVDLWLEKTVRHADLVVVRLLGGACYWSYGVDELSAAAASGAFKLALLPGDAAPDLALFERSTISKEDWGKLHALFTAGGPDNMDLVLEGFYALGSNQPLTEIKAKPFARFGLWWPEKGMLDADSLANISSQGTTRFSGPHPELVEGEGPLRERAFVPILFYRAALEGAGTATLERLIRELENAGLSPVPMVISTLKEGACIRFAQAVFKRFVPDVILNLTGFALGLDNIDKKQNPFANIDAPIIQLLQAGRAKKLWQQDMQGLSAKDLAMQIVLPEMDGRIGALIVGHKDEALWHQGGQCSLAAYQPDNKGIARAVRLAGNWVRLRQLAPSTRRIGIVLANYPIRDGRIANGVGYDAPQSTLEILKALSGAGYQLAELPEDGNELIEMVQQGPTNADPERGKGGAVLALDDYLALFSAMPEKIRKEVIARWGKPEDDPFCRQDGFHLPVILFGNIAVLLQPARGYDRDIEASYHDPDLVPPHAYLASYLWLREVFAANALIHNGKHGSLEWLPGKAIALDENSYPLALWAEMPHLYPFIVNDPGEGSQAKRRTGAVIIDHLVPPLTRAETYGPLKDLEALLDEYYAASGMDRRRLADLKRRILDFTRDGALDKDIALPANEDEALGKIDNFLCELKEAQIRDGLHVFGCSPTGDMERDLIVALARAPRGEEPGENSLVRALADDFKLGFDPLSAKFGERWNGPKPAELAELSDDIWRSEGDTVERLELLAAKLVSHEESNQNLPAASAVLRTIEQTIRPRLKASGPSEIRALLDALNGKFIAPGPSGAPSRGRLDVLPTG